ncbi:MAG: hypothetical protein ACT4PM_14955, partial [Gemmatimonadales bacterium]
RKYGVSCNQCHVLPPKLNAYGERFLAQGYWMPGLVPRRTWPFAVWVSGRADRIPRSDELGRLTKAYLNRIEVISGGKVVAPWLWYFAEWRPVSFETRGDGTLRDRSGRFEDLFVTATAGPLEAQLGQFRQIAQVDVSRRVGLSEPVTLSGSLPGGGDGTPREIALRALSPAGRSPAVRMAWNPAVGTGWRFTAAAGLPLPGEFSIPLTKEARDEASNEIEWDPKGVVLEAFLRRGLTSLGGHAFLDGGGRFLANAVMTGSRQQLHWTVVAGVARWSGVTRGQWSAEGEYYLSQFIGFGGRGENRTDDGAGTAFLPHLNIHFPGSRYTFRLTLEQRIQRDRGATLLEFGTVF